MLVGSVLTICHKLTATGVFNWKIFIIWNVWNYKSIDVDEPSKQYLKIYIEVQEAIKICLEWFLRENIDIPNDRQPDMSRLDFLSAQTPLQTSFAVQEER